MQHRQDKTSRRKIMYHLVDGHISAARTKMNGLAFGLDSKVEGLVDG